MFSKLKQILSGDDDADPYQQIDLALSDLQSGIDGILKQQQKLDLQEQEMTQKLETYLQEHTQTKTRAKSEFQQNNRELSASLLIKCDLLDAQIKRYRSLIGQIGATQRKLFARKAKLSFTKDKLLSQKALGEAELDASQLEATLAEQVMLLNESGALNQFDVLIEEANNKTQAITEIEAALADEHDITKHEDASSMAALESEIENEKNAKLETTLRKRQKIIQQVFGDIEEPSPPHKDRQRTLLQNLKEVQSQPDQKQQTIARFFDSQDTSNTQDSLPPINNTNKLVSSITPQKKQSQEDRINQFFNTK